MSDDSESVDPASAPEGPSPELLESVRAIEQGPTYRAWADRYLSYDIFEAGRTDS